MAIDNISEWPYSCAIPVWCVYEGIEFHLGNPGLEVLEQEAEDRRQRRIIRLRRASRLPVGKTWDTLEHDRLPIKLRQQLDNLVQGDFVDQSVNILAFGLPGTGKTHALCAIGHRLVEEGRSVLFTPAYRLVQDLLAAKRDLDLPRALRKLDNFDFLLIDDLGYLTQGTQESEVLFTLIAERYERRSLGVTRHGPRCLRRNARESRSCVTDFG